MLNQINESRTYGFSNERLKVSWMRNVLNYTVQPNTIVVNLGIKGVPIIPHREIPTLKNNPKVLSRWESAILSDVTIQKAELILLIEAHTLSVPDFTNRTLGMFSWLERDYLQDSLLIDKFARQEVIEGEWEYAADIYPAVKGIPLWKTPESKIGEDAGSIKFDPYFAIEQSKEYNPGREIEFKIRNYLWFTPQKSHCGIHNQHPFIEVHTQISGLGRIPKFYEQNPATIYEDFRMVQGRTQSQAYCTITEDEKMPAGITFTYPWHEYYSDTDCVWLVTEFHPKGC